jgi:hypothetical protein
VVLVIILKHRIRPIKRAPIMIVKVVLVITTRITIMERILVALEYKEGGKDKYYRLY